MRFDGARPDYVSAHLADDPHRPGDTLSEAHCLGAAGSPGESHAHVGGGGAADGKADDGKAHDGKADDGRADDGRAADSTAVDGEAGDSRAADSRRDERLADFTQDRYADTARPNAWHVMVLNDLTGGGARCPGATDDEVLGLMGRWKAAESWAAARKLGVVREMIRRRAVPEKGMASAGLPWEWEPDLEHEVAAQLRVSLVAAGKLLHLAWSLQARLPRVGDALAEGRLDPGQATMIVAETDALPDDKAAAAEELILAGLDDCHTWADLLRLVQRAVCTVDPDGARRRREQAERQTARVRLWRESSGACALAGHALPTDQALAAWGHVEARAQHYRQQGIKEYIDLLRVMAYLDLLNGIPAADRIARWTADAADAPAKSGTAKSGTAKSGTATPTPGADGPTPAPGADPAPAPAPGRTTPGPRGTGNRFPGDEPPGDESPAHAHPADTGPRDHSPANARPAGTGPGNTAPSDLPEPGDVAASEPLAGPELRARVNLTIPMGTATGHHDRPGEAWELGVLDPELARQLLAAAARSQGSEFCVTVTDDNGYAVGHGCCRPAKPARPAKTTRPGRDPAGPAPPGSAPPGRPAFTQREGPGPPGGFGSWTLTLPGSGTPYTVYTVDLRPVPTHACDHAYQSAGHDPSDWLRHVVQVRDGKCSFPSCGRHARESDLEHATPHQDGGKTCACNCHACSRTCHQVKQRPGWNLTSPTPGWHQWTTPSGRVYVQGPWRYPS